MAIAEMVLLRSPVHKAGFFCIPAKKGIARWGSVKVAKCEITTFQRCSGR